MKPARSRSPLSLAVRAALALVLTAGLLLFLVVLRMQRHDDTPLLTLRSMETVDPVSVPAPPPPPEELTPTPPPALPELPELDLEIDPQMPAVSANPEPQIDLALPTSDFAPATEPTRRSMTFSASQLDAQPRLVNRPSVTFPKTLANRGITEGKVVLEVLISSAGNVDVRRVLEASHTELTEMGRSFASRSKFTPPKKDGRPVTAVFRWPLVLKL